MIKVKRYTQREESGAKQIFATNYQRVIVNMDLNCGIEELSNGTIIFFVNGGYAGFSYIKQTQGLEKFLDWIIKNGYG